jgi:hypothetical protein
LARENKVGCKWGSSENWKEIKFKLGKISSRKI